MLTIGTIPVLLRIISKIDIKPVIEKLSEIDIGDISEGKSGITEISKEKIGMLVFEAIAEITPQFGKIADDIPELVAAYKCVSVEEAKKLDALEVINELAYDDGVKSFFARALRKKVGQEA